MKNGTVKPDGSFAIYGVPPGEYILRTAGPMNGDAASAIVTVNGSDIGDIQLVSVPPAVVTGRLLFDPGAALPKPSTVRVSISRAEALPGNASTTAKDDFTFELKAAPGHGTLNAFVMPSGGIAGTSVEWQVKRVIWSGDDITDTGIEIPADGSISNLVVELTANHPELSGIVRDANGQPVQDCWVIVFAQDSRRWTGSTRYVMSNRPGSNDRFRVRVPPGNYFAVAVDDVERGQWQDPEYLGRLIEKAVSFSLADGEKKTFDLKLGGAR
jgi:hypothetical protein